MSRITFLCSTMLTRRRACPLALSPARSAWTTSNVLMWSPSSPKRQLHQWVSRRMQQCSQSGRAYRGHRTGTQHLPCATAYQAACDPSPISSRHGMCCRSGPCLGVDCSKNHRWQLILGLNLREPPYPASSWSAGQSARAMGPADYSAGPNFVVLRIISGELELASYLKPNNLHQRARPNRLPRIAAE